MSENDDNSSGCAFLMLLGALLLSVHSCGRLDDQERQIKQLRQEVEHQQEKQPTRSP